MSTSTRHDKFVKRWVRGHGGIYIHRERGAERGRENDGYEVTPHLAK